MRVVLIAILIGLRGLEIGGLPGTDSSGDGMSIATYLFLGLLAALAVVQHRGVLFLSGRQRMPYYWPYLWLLAICCGAALLAIGFGSIDVELRGAFSWIGRLAVNLLVVHLIYVVFATARDLTALFVGIITGCLLILGLIIPNLLSSVASGDVWRVGTFGTNFNTVTYSLAMGFWIAGVVHGVLGRQRPLLRWVNGGLAGAFAAAVVLTGSRGGVYALVLLSVLALVVSGSRRARLRVGGGLVVLGMAAVMVVLVFGDSFAIARITNPFSVTSSADGGARDELLVYTIEQVTEAPGRLIFGAGAGSFSVVSVEESRYLASVTTTVGTVRYPHNAFLDILFNLGLPATVVMLVLVIHGIVLVLRPFRQADLPAAQRTLTVGLTGLWIVVLVSSITTFDVTANIGLWILLGASASLANLVPESRAETVNRLELRCVE